MDLSNLLNKTKINTESPNTKITNADSNIPHKQPDNTQDRFKIPWNKLEKGMKLNRIIINCRRI